MEQISRYFNSEKQESVLFILAGTFSVLFSIFCFIRLRSSFFNGMSYALLSVASIQIAVGITVFLRSPKDILRVGEIVKQDKGKINAEEIPRMKAVMKNFVIYRWVEIGLLIIGLLLFFIYPAETTAKGIGLGLSVQAATMLVLDFFAEKRGKKYLDFLLSL